MLWRQVFGNRFPDTPNAKKAMRIEEIIEDGEDGIFDPLIEAEISEIKLPFLPEPKEKLRIRAGLAYEAKGHVYQQYPSASRAVTKGIWIQFSVASTDVTPPYSIRWTVENHGKEAEEAEDMGHERVTSWQEPYQWEHTKYRGTHYMICEIIKSGAVVARAKHTVSIK